MLGLRRFVNVDVCLGVNYRIKDSTDGAVATAEGAIKPRARGRVHVGNSSNRKKTSSQEIKIHNQYVPAGS